MKTKNKKSRKNVQNQALLDFGSIGGQNRKLLVLTLFFVFLQSLVLVPNFFGINLFRSEQKEKFTQEIPVDRAKLEFQNDAKELVAGYPIEKMLPYIFKHDKQVATFMLSIAKKESNWGKRVPVSDGEDCYNYWGFRLKTERLGSGGHSCFDTPEEAVEKVAGRIEELVERQKRETAREMLVWKCGFSCEGQDPVSVNKWVSDVDYYNRLLLN